MNIYEKMLKATDSINKVAKNLKVGAGQNQYKAVGEADVLEAVKPIEVELGIYSYPKDRKIIEKNVFTTTSEYNGKVTEKNTLFLRIETIYRFVNTEKPEEYIDITTYGDGVDAQDKAPGKAMTYSDKYALLKAYKIETGEDPDQHMSQNMKRKEVDEIEEIEKKLVDKVNIAAMQAEMLRTGVKPQQILMKYNAGSLESLNKKQFVEIMQVFSKTPDKEK